MKSTLQLVLVYLLVISCSNSLFSQKIDTTPLDAYWEMTASLKKGDSLSKDRWQTFLNIEANKVYIDNQGFDTSYLERLRKTIEIVYMPKHDSIFKIRVAVIEKDTASYWLTYKVYVYKKFEKELKAYESELVKTSYLDAAYQNTFNWLPKSLQKRDSKVNVFFLGIENDAIAGNGIVIATLWSAYNNDKLKMGILLGHELHHVLRKGIGFITNDESDKGILYALTSILNEGTADMIDKPSVIEHDAELPMGSKMKEFLLFQADSIVKVIDENILEMTKTNAKSYKTEKEYRNLVRWTSGHCPGYYMTDIIVRNGFRKQLLENIQNPFYFIYLYNKAAKKDAKKPHFFDDKSISYIKQLEKKYWNKS